MSVDLPGEPPWDGAPWRRGDVIAEENAEVHAVDFGTVVPACSCGWTGGDIPSAGADADLLAARAEDAWNWQHAAGLLADAIPDDLSHRAHAVLTDIGVLAETRPLAMLALLTGLAHGGDGLAVRAVRAAVLAGVTWEENGTATGTNGDLARERWARGTTEPGPPEELGRS